MDDLKKSMETSGQTINEFAFNLLKNIERDFDINAYIEGHKDFRDSYPEHLLKSSLGKLNVHGKTVLDSDNNPMSGPGSSTNSVAMIRAQEPEYGFDMDSRFGGFGSNKNPDDISDEQYLDLFKLYKKYDESPSYYLENPNQASIKDLVSYFLNRNIYKNIMNTERYRTENWFKPGSPMNKPKRLEK